MTISSSDRFPTTAAYLSAGGRGTRLQGSVPSDPEYGIAKALVEVGRPRIKLVDHHLNKLYLQGFRDIIVGAGDQSAVKDHVERTYSHSVVRVDYHEKQYGTGGDLLRAAKNIVASEVYVQNVDTILDVDPIKFLAEHTNKANALTIALTRRKSVPNQDAFSVDNTGLIMHSTETTTEPPANPDAVSYHASSTGAVMASTEYLASIAWNEDEPISLYADILGEAIKTQSLGAYDNGEFYFLDVGTPETLAMIRQAGNPVQYQLFTNSPRSFS